MSLLYYILRSNNLIEQSFIIILIFSIEISHFGLFFFIFIIAS